MSRGNIRSQIREEVVGKVVPSVSCGNVPNNARSDDERPPDTRVPHRGLDIAMHSCSNVGTLCPRSKQVVMVIGPHCLGWAKLRNFQEMVPSKPGIPGFETSRILEEVEKVEVAVPLAIVR
jgi:hypothetical protein